MNPSSMFCPHESCPNRGLVGQGNIVIHSQKERRYRCLVCAHSFAETKGTPFYRLRTEAAVVTLVVTLMAHGCPRQAIVAAFGFDERTVAAWGERAGAHCAQVHQATVQQGQVDVAHVQADELWVKLVGRKLWLALALAVPSRLWLGGVLAADRDGALIRRLAEQVRQCARDLGLLVCVDGFSSYLTAFPQVFRELVRARRGGRPRKQRPAGFLLGQVRKLKVQHRVVGVLRRAVIGTPAEIKARVQHTGGGRDINTAFIERLNATFRSRLVPLIRRGRCLARHEATLTAGMSLVGTVYNFCCYHDSLRQPAPVGPGKWYDRTPAMAAGLTEHRWSVRELLEYRVPPAPWSPPPRRRGRPPKEPRSIPWKLRPHRKVLCESTV